MKLKCIIQFLIITLLLTACGYPMPTMVPTVSENPTVPPTSYPEPVVGTLIPYTPIYPEPATPGTGKYVIPPSGYEPQPGDNLLQRDQVLLELENSPLVVKESLPVQVSLNLNGNLSDPCHQLRVVVTPVIAQKEISLDVYSVFNPKDICITVLKPFSVTIPLGSYAGGHFTVRVNGQLVGEFDA